MFSKLTAGLRPAVVCCVMLLAGVFSLRAQTQEREVRVYYPFDNAVVSSSYFSNSESLALLDSLYKAGCFNGNQTLEVVSYSSPEGQYAYNVNLSKRRAEAFRRYIVSKYPDLEGRLTTSPNGESWADLREAVVNDSRMSEIVRNQLLRIIDSDARPDTKEAKLKENATYKRLYANYFKRFRYAYIRVKIENSNEAAPSDDNSRFSAISDSLANQSAHAADSSKVDGTGDTAKTADSANTIVDGIGKDNNVDSTALNVSTDTTDINADKHKQVVDTVRTNTQNSDTTLVSSIDTTATAVADTTVVVPTADSITVRPKKMIAAVKTNLLYDAVTALNVEVEVPIGRHFSVMVEDVFPWWETGNKYCFQMWEMGLEGRYWFKGWDPNGREKLRGWFAGVYGMSAKYDFQWDRDVNLQGEYWSAGISGGYAMPIGRKKRVNLEFSLAVGPMHTVFRHYQPTQTYDKLIRDPYNAGIDYKTGQWYFGPTKAKVSLVVPICVPTKAKKEVRYE